MRPLPTQQLNPKIKAVWRINDAIWLVLSYGICAGILGLIIFVGTEEGWTDDIAGVLMMSFVILTVLFLALLFLFLIVLPPIRYARWRYELSSDYLDIARGIIWRKRFIIPFIRVQNTDTQQGPILRAFGLASVTISTAAGSHEIPGLDYAEAEVLRDKAAELARLAREDV